MFDVSSIVRAETLRSTDRGTVERVFDSSGASAIRRTIRDDVREVYAALAKLDHPAIVRVISCELVECDTVVFEEEVAGEPLSLSAVKCDLRRADVIAASRQLTEALAVLESESIIHRDIKPDNIMTDGVGADRRVVLIDFGISRIHRRDAQRDTKARGTEGWAAPEQYGFAQTDARSDIYSVGRVIRALCDAAKLKPRDPLRAFAAKCSAFDPSARFQTSREARDALRALISRPKKFAAAALVSSLLIAIASIFFSSERATKSGVDLTGVGPIAFSVDAPHTIIRFTDGDEELDDVIKSGPLEGIAIKSSVRGSVFRIALSHDLGSVYFEEDIAERIGGDAAKIASGTRMRAAEIIFADLSGDGVDDIIVAFWDAYVDLSPGERSARVVYNGLSLHAFELAPSGWRHVKGDPLRKDKFLIKTNSIDGRNYGYFLNAPIAPLVIENGAFAIYEPAR